MKKFALIVAGGSGTRMKSEVPKQFLDLLGKPLLMHTIEAFTKYDPKISIIVVIPEIWMNLWKERCRKHHFAVEHKLVAGGEIRFRSVQNGLNQIKEDGIVFIHDGVRPLVSEDTIQQCYKTAVEKGNSLPVVPVSESVRKQESNNSKAVDRSKYFLVQTPQTFKVSLIQKAYNQSTTEDFTDDATVLESMGVIINLTKGNRENIKITYPEDLLFAKAVLTGQ
jgi:2-C-methyl-D-erythritol 4-phosphate cytidylyltransferase